MSDILTIVEKCEEKLQPYFREIDKNTFDVQNRVLKAFLHNRVSDNHFAWNTGYGYDDLGREITEKVYAQVFGGEKALVRTNIVNGTHAIALALLGVLRAGDELVYCTGTPYDTMQSVIGLTSSGHDGSLRDLGIQYSEIPLKGDKIDFTAVEKCILLKHPKMIAVQRSMGYGWREVIDIDQIKRLVELIKPISPDTLIMVDNCYCEFTANVEPNHVGADLACGSLIKNPGGGLALSGGYISGKSELIDMIAYRMTCPGIGSECGLTYGQTRGILQGLFIAPHVTAGALKGAMLCGAVYSELGFKVCPSGEGKRQDIIQAVQMGTPEAVSAFCEGIQSSSPIDGHVAPVAAPMPGYDDEIIMAAGTFIQGASIELSADGPMREPYNVYFQGGITYEHAKIGIIASAENLLKKGIIHI